MVIVPLWPGLQGPDHTQGLPAPTPRGKGAEASEGTEEAPCLLGAEAVLSSNTWAQHSLTLVFTLKRRQHRKDEMTDGLRRSGLVELSDDITEWTVWGVGCEDSGSGSHRASWRSMRWQSHPAPAYIPEASGAGEHPGGP